MGQDDEFFYYPDIEREVSDLKNDEENQVMLPRMYNIENTQVQSDFILVVDRIEGNIAVCEKRATREILEIELSKLPSGIKEGNVVRYINGFYILDIEEQKNIEQRIAKKMDDLWN